MPVPESRPRRIAVGSDLRHDTAEEVARHLERRGCAVVKVGAVGGTDTPWPDVAEAVALLVAAGDVAQGVLCCWTGTGVCMAANKVPGVRAALCPDAATAQGARRWNDANVLTLSLAATSTAAAREILDAWLATEEVDPDESGNIGRLAEIERRHRQGAATS